MIRKILGPPGTGKTTKLIGNKELKVPGYVSTFLKLGTPLNRIGYFAFTKRAANEAKERMLKLYPQYGYRDLKYFQTLHSGSPFPMEMVLSLCFPMVPKLFGP